MRDHHQILYTLKAYGPVNDVRLIRDKATGESRCFAFVEFPSAEEAQKFMDYHRHTRLDLDGRAIYMDYSKQKEPHPASGGSEYKDWICPQVSAAPPPPSCVLCTA
jgi:RNA recognition motif-containing protein